MQVRLHLGLYIVFIQDWLTVFHQDQILVLRLEDYAANLKTTIKTVFDFLSVGTCHRVMYSVILVNNNITIVEKQQSWGLFPPCRSSVRAGRGSADQAADAEQAASCRQEPGAHASNHQKPAQGISSTIQP